MQDRTVEVFKRFVKNGHYEKDPRGLSGKYDNVRRYWEDKLTQYALRSHIARLVEETRSKLQRLSVLDLGCGSGEGYELLTNIEKENIGIQSHQLDMIGLEAIGRYTGIDINTDMIDKAKDIYSTTGKFSFKVGDLNEGIPFEKNEPPYDLYYSSYGSMSHIDDEALKRLLIEIAQHARNGSLFVGDWLGRYSYEWPVYWKKKDGKKMRDYSMSWLCSEGTENTNTESFPLRFWSREEIDALLKEVEDISKVKFQGLSYTDRAIFVGRHMDTKEYNKHAQPIRNAVNKLHADNMRTDLTELIIDYFPSKGYKAQNKFFEGLQVAWNTLVNFTIERLGKPTRWPLPAKVEKMDKPLKDQVKTMNRVIKNVGWIKMGDPRANIIEPQLGYALRGLEMSYQQGKGMAHSLIGIFRIVKK
ncbi:MAG: class I SAM-dependent DNA methyltransferase [Thermodesulfobacteriota bacterium]